MSACRSDIAYTSAEMDAFTLVSYGLQLISSAFTGKRLADRIGDLNSSLSEGTTWNGSDQAMIGRAPARWRNLREPLLIATFL
jgi:hypothetical protein